MPAVKHVVIGRCSEYAVACLDEEWDNARRLTEVWNKPVTMIAVQEVGQNGRRCQSRMAKSTITAASVR